MKTLKKILVATVLFLNSFANAQVDVNINLGTPPVWGPAVTTEEYYFLPDINSYYDIRQSQFIYLNNGTWIRTKVLPRRYRSYNLNTGYIVVLNDYVGRNPYSNYKSHKVKYFKGTKYKVDNHDNGNHNGNKKGKKKSNKNGNGKGKNK